jgi:carbon storage regulator
MLVLSRKLHESIIINDNIRVTIVEIKGDRVRFGITAPPEVRVDREEVARRIQEFVGPQVVEALSP